MSDVNLKIFIAITWYLVMGFVYGLGAWMVYIDHPGFAVGFIVIGVLLMMGIDIK